MVVSAPFVQWDVITYGSCASAREGVYYLETAAGERVICAVAIPCEGNHMRYTPLDSFLADYRALLPSGPALEWNFRFSWLHGWMVLSIIRSFATVKKVVDVEFHNVKALYRPAQAYLQTADLHLAESDIKKALEADPHNREVKLIQKNLKQLQAASDKRDVKLYVNMFVQMKKDPSVSTKLAPLRNWKSIMSCLCCSNDDMLWPLTMHSSWDIMHQVMGDITNRASSDDTGKKFATGEANYSPLQQVYGLTQCTPNLSDSKCNICLQNCIALFPACCDAKQGGRVSFQSCNVRYEMYPFYNASFGAASVPLRRHLHQSSLLSPPPPSTTTTSSPGLETMEGRNVLGFDGSNS